MNFGLKVAAFALALLPSVAFSQGCVEDTGDRVTVSEAGGQFTVPVLTNYIANIAERDLYNSKGVRLGGFAAVLQQDRANFHKSGRADGSGVLTDGADNYFVNLARRSELATATYYTDCYMSAAQTRALQNGIANGRVGGVVWVLPFRHPNGSLGVYISGVN
ncbi:MAG: hypothetical protein COB08_007975 [Rhodobacteraceae bacterium]|nr:hypothetical protein [Paracoccaceae bacterium]